MNGLYSIDRNQLSTALPHELVNHITQAEWTCISIAVNDANVNVQSGACLVEAGVCFFTCCFCVFFFHPCISNAFADSSVPQKIMPLNNSLFRGQPVIGYMNNRVTVNTGLLAQIGHNAGTVSPAHVEYVTATPMIATAHVEPIHVQATAPPAHATEYHNKA